MDRVNGDNWVDIGGGRRGFQSQSLVNGVIGTEVTDDFLNGLQEELVGLIEGAGLEPVEAAWDQVARSIRSQRLNWVAVPGGTADALTVALAPAPAAYDDIVGMPIRIKIADPNTGAASLNVNGLGALEIVTPRGNSLARRDLVAGMIAEVICTGDAFVMTGIAYSDFRPILNTDLDLYVAPWGSDTADGLYYESPFATLQHAWDYLQARFDLNGKQARIRAADGTYTGVVTSGSVLGQNGQTKVMFVGNAGSPTSCTISAPNGSCFLATGYSQYGVDGFQLTSTGGGVNQGYGLACQGGSINWKNIYFGANAQAHVFSQNGVAQAGGQSVISGSSGAAFQAQGYGTIQFAGQTVNVAGTPAFGAFVYARTAIVSASGATVTGTATGKRFDGGDCAVIATNGGGPYFFPGDADGSYDATSSYI